MIECGVHVACIGHIDEALILHLKSQGTKSVTVVHCERCFKGVDVEKERQRIEKLGVSFREKPEGAALRVEHRLDKPESVLVGDVQYLSQLLCLGILLTSSC
jgi:acyl CoA:acetate/3-ketoacid CoA transferase alpha subunit